MDGEDHRQGRPGEAEQAQVCSSGRYPAQKHIQSLVQRTSHGPFRDQVHLCQGLELRQQRRRQQKGNIQTAILLDANVQVAQARSGRRQQIQKAIHQPLCMVGTDWVGASADASQPGVTARCDSQAPTYRCC